MMMGEIKIGVDWAQGDDKTCVVFVRKEDDGTFTATGELFGEPAEHVAELEKENAKLKKENGRLERIIAIILS